MTLYLRPERNQDFFNEFAHELATGQKRYKDITLGYKKDFGFAVEALSRQPTYEAQKDVVREYTKAANELLRLVQKKRWGPAEDDAHVIRRLEATLHTCQQLEQLTQKLSKKCRSALQTKPSAASQKQLKELHKVEKDFSSAKRSVTEGKPLQLATDEVNVASGELASDTYFTVLLRPAAINASSKSAAGGPIMTPQLQQTIAKGVESLRQHNCDAAKKQFQKGVQMAPANAQLAFLMGTAEFCLQEHGACPQELRARGEPESEFRKGAVVAGRNAADVTGNRRCRCHA